MRSILEALKKFYFHKDVDIAYTRVYATLGSSGFIFVMLDSLFVTPNPKVAGFSAFGIINLIFGTWLFEKGLRKFVKVYRPSTTMLITFVCIQETGGIHSPMLFWFSNLIMGAMFSYGLLPTAIVLAFEVLIVSYFNFSGTPVPTIYLQLIASLFVMLAIGVMFSKVSDFYFAKLMKQKARTEEKSQQVKALLDGIPQGILTLGPEGSILPDYSRHLLSILEVEKINGDFRTMILQRSELSKDVLDQCWQSIVGIIGMDSLNYEANVDKLLREIQISVNGQTKYLKCTWNTEIKDDTVTRMLVTLLDVTKEKLIEQKAEAQAREFAVIKELIDVDPRKVQQFFISSQLLLRENVTLNQNLAQRFDFHTLQMMFVNLHTVKGAARTLGLKELANVLHQVEDAYQAILKNEVTFDAAHLAEETQRTLGGLNRYREVNREKLNRPDNPVSACENLQNVFEDYKTRAEDIAADLGKAKPICIFQIASVQIGPETRTLIDNCMVHLLRNALDHGIEVPDDRTKAGKSEQGTLRAEARVEGEVLVLRFADDGRGLALSQLLTKGMAQGLLKQGSSLQEIADIIFHPGLSTAKTVSAFSGRGVGMDAVRSFLQRNGGSIEIELADDTKPGALYASFTFVIHLRNWASQHPLSRAS